MTSATTHDREIEIPVDGLTVRATRHGPTDQDERPVILSYTPYHKDDLSDTRSDPRVAYFVDAGYEVVVADAVGTGASDGLVEQPFTADEGRHGAAVVEWLAARSWSNGRVGIIGRSYPGTTALEIAAQQPDGLAAIVPIHAPARIYDAYFDGGALALLRTCGQWAPNFEYLPLQPPAKKTTAGWGRRWRHRLEGLRDRQPFLFQYLDHQEKDEYWARKDVPVDQITVPTLAVGGYRDAFGGGTLRYAERIDAPTEVLLGPWRHADPEQGETARIDFLGETEQWFDEHLRDGSGGRGSKPPIRYWTEQPSPDAPLAGQWRRRTTWPRADSDDDTVTFIIGEDGLQRNRDTIEPVSDRWTVDYSVGTASIGFEVPGGTDLNTTPDDIRSLCYETPALEGALELTGTGSAGLTIVPDGSAQLVAVRIIDVAPDGTGALVTHGVTRAEIQDDPVDPPGTPGVSAEPLVPDEPQSVSIPLRPTSHVFAPGHRLRIAVSGAFFPYVSPPDGSGSFTLKSTPAAPGTVNLPGRYHNSAPEFEDTYTFDPPQDVYDQPTSPSWETTTDHTDDTVTVSFEQTYTKPLPDAEFKYEMSIEATVQRSVLASETIARETTTKFRYPTETVQSRVNCSVSRSFATIQYRVLRDDEEVYTERKHWSE